MSAQTGASGDIRIRLLREEDVEQTARLIAAGGTTISGLADAGVFLPVCRDALGDRRVVMVLAVRAGEPVGYAFAVSDWQEYWRGFARRNPGIGLRVAWSRLADRVGIGSSSGARRPTDEATPEGVVPVGTTGRHWGESSPTIGKVIDVVVDPSCRGGGIGGKLLRAMFAELAARGVTRADCRTEIDNASSIRMEIKAGWTMEMTGTRSLFGTIDLERDPDGEPDRA